MTTQRKSAPNRLPQKERPSFETASLIGFSLLTGILFFYAIQNLIVYADNWLRPIVMALGATLTSYAINRFAIEKGAELAALRIPGAAAVSIGSICLVAISLFPSTYGGITIEDVKELRYQEFFQRASGYVDEQHERSAAMANVVPLLDANTEELLTLRDCEQRESCLSGKSTGGRGIVTKELEKQAKRAESISEQIKAGLPLQESALERISELLDQFNATLKETDKPFEERQLVLGKHYNALKREVVALNEAIPSSLIISYKNELETGVVIPRRQQASRKLNEVLGAHAGGLNQIIKPYLAETTKAPELPTKTGVMDTFKYIDHFLPIAMIALCIELLLPLSLWLYVYWGLVWRKHLAELSNSPRYKH